MMRNFKIGGIIEATQLQKQSKLKTKGMKAYKAHMEIEDAYNTAT